MQTISIFEYDTLRVGEQGFTAEHFERLACWHSTQPKQYFSLGYESITFKQFVGVMCVGGLTLQILPKIDREAQEDAGKMQKILLQMLHACQKITIESSQQALLDLQSLTLLDLYIELFLQETQFLLRKGLVKKYRQESGNLYTLKGALQFSKHLAYNAVHQERFYTQHQVYDHEHALNQILHKALHIVARFTQNPYLTDKIGRLRADFPTLQDIKVTEKTFERIPFNRKTIGYRKAITLAKMILLHYMPDVQGGRQDTLAILFDMNKLFEEYVAIALGRGLVGKYDITTQIQEKFWKGENATLRLRPDILLASLENPKDKIVLDTKWKMPQDDKPSSADIYQMFAYCAHFGTTQSLLLYPTAGKDKLLQGNFRAPNEAISCGLWFINLLDEDGNLKRALHFPTV
ncbi:MAG: restriction endonuclease [Bacteroidetes bacterium]|nr:MAG: restriction endonuclease [Bacteroidota bacterium]